MGFSRQKSTGVGCHCLFHVRSMSQGRLEVVKQEMARVNVDILGISKLKWTGMGEFNPDDLAICNAIFPVCHLRIGALFATFILFCAAMVFRLHQDEFWLKLYRPVPFKDRLLAIYFPNSITFIGFPLFFCSFS